LDLDITCLGLNIRPGCVGSLFDVGLEAGRFTTVDVDIGCLTCSIGFVFIPEVTNGTTR